MRRSRVVLASSLLAVLLGAGCGHEYVVNGTVADRVASWKPEWRKECAVAGTRDDGEKVWIRSDSLSWSDAGSELDRRRVRGERRWGLFIGGVLLAAGGGAAAAGGIAVIRDGMGSPDDTGAALIGLFPLIFGLGHLIAGIPMVALGPIPHAAEVSVQAPPGSELMALRSGPADACAGAARKPRPTPRDDHQRRPTLHPSGQFTR